MPKDCTATMTTMYRILSREEDYFNPRVNPAFEYCEVKRFLAYEGDRVVGRVAAILNSKYNEKTGEKRMRFSRFDVEDNPKAAEMLLKAVENFAKEKGMEIVHGPIGFSDLDKQGMLIEGFNRLDTSMTIYNYPYYPEFVEACGYKKEGLGHLLKPRNRQQTLVLQPMSRKHTGFGYHESLMISDVY